MRPAWFSGVVACCAASAACRFDEPLPLADASGPGDGAPPGDTACPDDDRDGVCNAADRCLAGDDRLDGDDDDIPDACDPWPCGEEAPRDPGDDMTDGESGRFWGATDIEIGAQRRAVVTAGAELTVALRWQLLINCPGLFCRAQIEYGFGEERAGCLFTGDVPDNFPASGTVDTQVRVPAAPGTYELRLNAGLRNSCGTATEWYQDEPGEDSTIAYVCVRP